MYSIGYHKFEMCFMDLQNILTDRCLHLCHRYVIKVCQPFYTKQSSNKTKQPTTIICYKWLYHIERTFEFEYMSLGSCDIVSHWNSFDGMNVTTVPYKPPTEGIVLVVVYIYLNRRLLNKHITIPFQLHTFFFRIFKS